MVMFRAEAARELADEHDPGPEKCEKCGAVSPCTVQPLARRSGRMDTDRWMGPWRWCHNNTDAQGWWIRPPHGDDEHQVANVQRTKHGDYRWMVAYGAFFETAHEATIAAAMARADDLLRADGWWEATAVPEWRPFRVYSRNRRALR